MYAFLEVCQLSNSGLKDWQYPIGSIMWSITNYWIMNYVAAGLNSSLLPAGLGIAVFIVTGRFFAALSNNASVAAAAVATGPMSPAPDRPATASLRNSAAKPS